MRKIVSLLSVLMLFCALAFGQTRTITGHVRDDKGEAIPFATITEAGTRNAVRADANGSFSIKVNQGAKLVISAVGFEVSNVTPAGAGDENFVLATTAGMIQENVIITAQGLKRRPKELGYSAAQVTTSDITVGQSPRVGQALSGKVSGLTIFNIDASVDPQVKVVLRGYRSLTGNNDALVVIDGIPYANQTSLASLNPNDIESISVLKGGQAATLYGSAGVNGVLLVTTKRGNRGKLKVNYSNTTNFEKLAWLPDFQDQYGSGSHYAAGFGTAGYKTNYLDRMHDNWRPFENQQYGDAYNGEQRIIGRVTEDGDKFILPYSPIEGERQRAWNTGFTTNNQIGFSGGDQTSTYYLSAENNYTEGIVYGDKSRRTGVRIAATKEVGKLRVGFNAAYVQAGYDRTTSDFYFDAINQAAHIPLSQLRDWRNNKFANPNGYYNDYYNNPYFNADNNRQKYADANLSGAFEINYKLLPWLNVYDRVGVINNSRTRKNYTSKFIYSDWAKNDAYVPAPWDYANDYDGIDRAGTNILGSVLDRITNDNTLNNEFQLHLDKDFGQFSNKLVLGASIFQQRQKQIEVSSGSLVQDSLYNVGNRQGELGGGEFNTTYRKYGYYADLTTGWRDFLFVHGSVRLDASSVFFTPNRDKSLYQYFYYGADASFILTEALPGIKSSFLNYAKVRAGFSRNGNDPLKPYELDLVLNNGPGFPYGNTVGYTVGNILPDPGLKPEFVNSLEAGLELQLLKNRINFDFTAYTQKSIGQVITVRVPNTTGFTNLRLNVGETKNWGFESDLRVQIIKKSKFSWEMSANYSYNNNKVLKLFEGVNEFAYGGYAYASTYVIKDRSFPTLKATGYVRDAASGRILVSRTTGYPSQTPNLLDFGRTTPPHVAGLGTRLKVGDFSFAANAEYRGGNKIFHQIGRDMTFTGAGGWTADRTPHVFPNSSYIDAGGKVVENTNVNVQEAEYSLWVDYYRLIAENFVTPGWFIKLRDVSLTYNLPNSIIGKTKGIISGASIGVFGRNLLTVVDKSNVFTDPEFSYTSDNGQGINNSLNTPPVRQYGFNINITF